MARISSRTSADFRRAGRKVMRLAKAMRGPTGVAVRRIGEEIMTDVKAASPGKGVPVDTGTLRSTGTVEGPDARGAVVLSFGGPAAPYALVQHERTDFAHRTGEARYLVRGVERWDPDNSGAVEALKTMTTAAIRVVGRT